METLKNLKNYIVAGLTALLILAGAVFWRNRGQATPAAVKAIAEDKSKEIVETAKDIQSTNTSIADLQAAAVASAQPVKPAESRKLEDALKEWNKS